MRVGAGPPCPASGSTRLEPIEDRGGDRGVDRVSLGEQGLTVALAGDDTTHDRGERDPVLALGELGEECLKSALGVCVAMGGGYGQPIGGSHSSR
jgi:hypothetical protein